MNTIARDIDQPALRFLRRTVGKSRHVFSLEDAQDTAVQLGISEGYMHQLLHRLTRTGWIDGIRRGLYASTGKLPGYSIAHDYAIATRLVEPSALCRFTALSYHELTEQIPFRAIHVMTPKKVVTPGMRSGKKPSGRDRHAWVIRGIHYEYFHVKPEHFFGIERAYVGGQLWVPMTDKERTVLDLFVAPSWAGSFESVYGILKQSMEDQMLNVEKLVHYAIRYQEASLIKRLGWCLEDLGVPEHVLNPLLESKIRGYRLLDPDRVAQGRCNKRWMLIDNLAATYEERLSKTS
jgi:predicted transcriptional regulator of viral defense system